MSNKTKERPCWYCDAKCKPERYTHHLCDTCRNWSMRNTPDEIPGLLARIRKIKDLDCIRKDGL